jgi:predicted metal-dependent hydrolase
MQARAEAGSVPYSVTHRNIRYPRLEFRTGSLLVVLPRGQDEKRILEKHRGWISKKYDYIRAALEASGNIEPESRSREELLELTRRLIDEYSRELECSPTRIITKKMVTKWASCSRRGCITINSDVKFLPEPLVKYVLFHEMLHLIHRKHDESFWKYINQKFDKPQELETQLCSYWFLIHKMK